MPVDIVPVYIVTDNARNLKSALQRSTWHQVQCFAHTLQLAVTNAKKEHNIDDLLAKGHAIICHYRHNTVAHERLHKFQCQLQKPQHELLPMVQTCWNSGYIMLSRLMEQQAPVTADLGTSLTADCFIIKEWKKAAEIVNMLNLLKRPQESCPMKMCLRYALKHVS
ncbi:hypothetical protein PR048_012872 [Dryococelus australis]|uniref:Transposase n=1 Tax=Dryococelus australis TaxID=614101 RepID=A0ABQ9HR85_9NEOP|nr:hypothetical protein PR048_012872 [Dryococelus australis]